LKILQFYRGRDIKDYRIYIHEKIMLEDYSEE